MMDMRDKEAAASDSLRVINKIGESVGNGMDLVPACIGARQSYRSNKEVTIKPPSVLKAKLMNLLQ